MIGMTYITWKERQTNGSLFEKTLSLNAKNIIPINQHGKKELGDQLRFGVICG